MRAFSSLLTPRPFRTLSRSFSSSTRYKVERDNLFGKYGLFGVVCVAGGLVAFDLNRRLENEEGAWQQWKKGVMTNYENRIRDYSSPEKVFNVFASKKKDGKFYMTADDFVRALLPHVHQLPGGDNTKEDISHETKGKKKKRDLPKAFKIADQDGDGLISFQEYLFFITLLSIPEKSFEIAFRLMDENGDGQVDQGEFMKMMGLLKKMSSHSQQAVTSSPIATGWLQHYFGVKANGILTFTDFSKFLKQLHSDVLKMEYDLYDRENKGCLSQRDFGTLLVSYANPSEFLPRTDRFDTKPLPFFTFEQFAHFNRLLEHLDEVETAMRLFQLNNRPFLKKDLQHTAHIICNADLNQQVIDTLMLIFDKNGDGSLEIDEFVTVMHTRASRGLTQPRDSGFVRSLNKVFNCIKTGGESSQ